MLICPKCQKTYDDGAQRFCLNDGVRLNPHIIKQSPAQTAGVFSGVLNKKGLFEIGSEVKNLSPKLYKNPIEEKAEPIKPEIRKPETEKTETKQPQTFSKLIKPDEVLKNQAPLGDRSAKPFGRVALTAENPNILLGQTIKGRYFIQSRISQTAHSIKYLAVDKLNSDKKTLVRIFTGKLDGSDFSAKIFADERVSLAHVNHPNIVRVFDSGELPEGNPFVVSDFVKGIALKETLTDEKAFGFLQTARLVKQAADAVGEAHQNGILHRNLNPENLILSVSETGSEQIKVTDFNIFTDKARGDFAFLAPEQIAGKSADISSDIYSLALVAYKMLTDKMPFSALTSKELFRAQQKGLQILPSALDAEIPSETDAVLRKALVFNPSERFQSIRDFGDAFYKSLISEKAISEKENVTIFEPEIDDLAVSLDSVLDEQDEPKTRPEEVIAPKVEILEQPSAPAFLKSVEREEEIPSEKIERTEDAEDAEETEDVALELEKPARVIKFQRGGLAHKDVEKTEPKIEKQSKPETEISWEKRSIEPPPQGGNKLTLFAILGIAALFVLTGAIFYFFMNRPAEPKITQVEIENQAAENEIAQTRANQTLTENKNNINEIPPPPRKIEQPEGTLFFENSKENLSKELLRNYRNFYLYYPKDWKVNKADDKFIDISKNSADGLPMEQFMVSYYDSDGTFELDKDNFPKIVEKASENIRNLPLPNFQLLGEGLIFLNKTDGYEGWKAYEMKFQGEGKATNGETIKLFGRHFYIPAARPGVKKGLVVTLLGTSLSDEIKSADDLGTKGDLKTILSTFEPDQNF